VVADVRDRGGDRVHDTDQVDVGGVDEVHRLGGVAERHGHDAGVRGDDVEAAELPDPLGQCVHQLGPFPHVGLLDDDSTIELLDLITGFFEVFPAGQRVEVRFDLFA
jgi:hypothetical protein